MADTNINVNKIDYQIRAEYDRRENLPDGSVLFLKTVEEGKDSAVISPYYYEGEYKVSFTHKTKHLEKFISIKRKSTNNYFMIACEVGVRTEGGNFSLHPEPLGLMNRADIPTPARHRPAIYSDISEHPWITTFFPSLPAQASSPRSS